MLILLIEAGVRSQQRLDYSFRHITQSDGLLHNDVFSIAQDEKGFMWIASLSGLQRFDGSRFVNYPDILSNPSEGLNFSAEIYSDTKKGLIWITNNTSIARLQLDKNRFTHFDREKMMKEPEFEFTPYMDNKNQTWMYGSHALYHYDSSINENVVVRVNFLGDNVPLSSYVASDSVRDQVWIVSGGSTIFLLDRKTKAFYKKGADASLHPLLDPNSYDSLGGALRFIMMDSYRNFWVTTWSDKLYRYDELSRKMTAYSLTDIRRKNKGSDNSLPTPLITCIIEDDNHMIWLATENAGLLRYNRERDNFDYCIEPEKGSEGIRYIHKIFNLFQDKEQNIWVGTDKGISIFNPYRKYFKSIRHEEDNPQSIGKSEINSFIQLTNGDMYLGTWGGGIAIYDRFFNFKKNLHFANNYDQNFVWSFQQVDEKTLWIGCQHGHLLIYDIPTGATQMLRPPVMEKSTIRCMERDKLGNVWMGLHNGKIVKWDKQQNKFLPEMPDTDPSPHGIQNILNIFIDSSQQAWVSTVEGFRAFDLETRTFTNTWLPVKGDTNSISGKTCEGIEEYNDSTLLIGTVYGGINFFNKKSKTFSHFSMADGLPSNTIYAIKKGRGGFFWLTTDYGLYRFNPAEKKIIPYSLDAGVINSSFISPKFYALQDGQWLTTTFSEAISFFPSKVEYQDNQQPPVEITGLKIFDKPMAIDSDWTANKPIRLSYQENFLTIEFAALSFLSLQQINYYYRLREVDKDWVNGGTNRFANYTDLQPGEYLFEVKTENGGHSGKISSLKINISPPFWKTWWFKGLIFFSIIWIIYLFIKTRESNLKARQQTQIEIYSMNEQLSKAKLEALRSQMNPHFIFNCINSIDALIQSNDKYRATIYLNKFAKLIRNVLDSSKQDTVTLSKDLDTLKLYIELEQLRHEDKFTANIVADEALLQEDFEVPPLIIQPFVENAILHGLRYRSDNRGQLSISVSKQGDYLLYQIEDNGVGRNSSNDSIQKGKTSYGIDMSNERVKLFNDEEKASVTITDLFDQDEPAGTKVEVLLKIQ